MAEILWSFTLGEFTLHGTLVERGAYEARIERAEGPAPLLQAQWSGTTGYAVDAHDALAKAIRTFVAHAPAVQALLDTARDP